MRLRWDAPLLVLGLTAIAQAADPLPKCTKCPRPDEATAPGVGFALDIGYGTAAIKTQEGTIQPIAKIAGSPEYITLMTRLATTEPELLPDGRRMPDVHSQQHLFFHVVKRWFTKLFGRPATPEIAVLAEMVQKLRIETEKVVGTGNVKGAVLVSHDRVRFTVEEVDDVFDFLGIRNVMRDGNELEETFRRRNGGLFGMAAGWAGLGRGLCGEYLDAHKCRAEEEKMEGRNVVHLDFGTKALGCAAAETVTTAQRSFADKSVVAPALGLGHAEEENYWSKVAKFVKGCAGQLEGGKVDEVVLTGESVGESKFKDAVREALKEKVDSEEDALDTLVAKSDKDPLYLVAMGAAEMAKRKQEGMATCVQWELDCKVIHHDEI